MADVHHSDAADEVDERVAIDVRDRRSVRFRGYDRRVHEKRTRDGVRLAFENLSRARAWNLGAELDDSGRRHSRSLRGAAYGKRASSGEVDLQDLDPDPIIALSGWLHDAMDALQPEAMTLATATATGQPSARMVLLRGLDERGLFFFTNRTSRKGRELLENPQAALVFHWPELGRQVRVEGQVEEAELELAAAYWESRPRGSRIAAWVSPQSEVVAGRAELDDRYAEADARFRDGPVPLPEFWGDIG